MNWQEIDLNIYPRRHLFNVFKNHPIPFFSVVVNLNITPLKPFTKTLDFGFFIPLSYIITLAINDIPQFRHRIINDKLIEFEKIDPGFTVLLENDLFCFCNSKFLPNFFDYANYTKEMIAKVKINPDYSSGDKNNMFFMTSSPWFSFTSVTHPYSEKYATIPIISIGKYFKQGDSLMLPFGLQIHHSIADGIHAAKLFEKIELMSQNPQEYLK